MRKRILFICTENSVLSIMAAGFARAEAPLETDVVCAGPSPNGTIHPKAVEVMRSHNVDINTQKASSLTDISDQTFDIVVALSRQSWENFPYFKGLPAILNWDLDVPAPDVNPNDDIAERFKKAAEILKTRVHSLFSHGYINTFSEIKINTDNILNSLSEGVFAHDLQRRIFYFSARAAELTGLSPEDVMGKDCHEIFTGGLCSDNCSFCNGTRIEPFVKKTYPITFSDRSGKRKECDLSVVPLKDGSGKIYGVAASLKDNSELNLMKHRKIGRAHV
jgi:PAS domain S-box-containing protein